MSALGPRPRRTFPKLVHPTFSIFKIFKIVTIVTIQQNSNLSLSLFFISTNTFRHSRTKRDSCLGEIWPRTKRESEAWRITVGAWRILNTGINFPRPCYRGRSTVTAFSFDEHRPLYRGTLFSFCKVKRGCCGRAC